MDAGKRTRMEQVSLVIPLRCDAGCSGHARLAKSVRVLSGAGVEVIIADGSAGTGTQRAHAIAFPCARQVQVVPKTGVNGKVEGVRRGVDAAGSERVVLADDDVIYDVPSLLAVSRLLDEAELVVPQNYFVGPKRWHTTWDTARTLINRAMGHDYPGTIALRRAALVRTHGYRDDVLFENLELIRTVRASGGRVRWAPDVFVPRLAPNAAAFFHQRIRQAYDDLAQVPRLLVEASILPFALASAYRRPAWLAVAAGAAIGVAEVGRRRDGGAQHFPAAASLAAPLWLLERGVCVWVAVAIRVVRGGILYRGARIRSAASSPRRLRRLAGSTEAATAFPPSTANRERIQTDQSGT